MDRYRNIILIPLIMLIMVVLIPITVNYRQQDHKNLLDQQTEVQVILTGGKERVLKLDEYLLGVVAGEMPAAFDLEALKAQAVAARTYTMYRLNVRQAQEHPGKLCYNPKHCQQYLTEAEMKARWKKNYSRYRQKLEQAVWDTDGIILTYQGQLIEPVYHASCGGLGTESPTEVWGGDKPYLTPQPCPEASQLEADQIRQVSLSKTQIMEKINTAIPAAAIKSSQLKKFTIENKTATGRVKTVRIGNIEMKATTLRAALGLRSTNFTMEQHGAKITFTTKGYGHGVGLCQEGSNLLAQDGADFKAILTHYYQGISFTQLNKI